MTAFARRLVLAAAFAMCGALSALTGDWMSATMLFSAVVLGVWAADLGKIER